MFEEAEEHGFFLVGEVVGEVGADGFGVGRLGLREEVFSGFGQGHHGASGVFGAWHPEDEIPAFHAAELVR